VCGDNWVASVRRTPGLIRPKPRSWLVTAIQARDNVPAAIPDSPG
jgi:hypothetical protein